MEQRHVASAKHEATELAKLRVSDVILNLAKGPQTLRKLQGEVDFDPSLAADVQRLLGEWNAKVQSFTDTIDHISGDYRGRNDLLKLATAAQVPVPRLTCFLPPSARSGVARARTCVYADCLQVVALGKRLAGRFVTVDALPLLDDVFWKNVDPRAHQHEAAADRARLLRALPDHLKGLVHEGLLKGGKSRSTGVTGLGHCGAAGKAVHDKVSFETDVIVSERLPAMLAQVRVSFDHLLGELS